MQVEEELLVLGFDYRVPLAEQLRRTLGLPSVFTPWSATGFCSADPQVWPSLFEITQKDEPAGNPAREPGSARIRLGLGEAPYFKAMGLWDSLPELLMRLAEGNPSGTVVALGMRPDHLASMPSDRLWGALRESLPTETEGAEAVLEPLGFDIVDVDGTSLLVGTDLSGNERAVNALAATRTPFGLIENLQDASAAARAIEAVVPEHAPIVPCSVSRIREGGERSDAG